MSKIETLRAYAEKAAYLNDQDQIPGNTVKAHKMLLALAGLNKGYDSAIDAALAEPQPDTLDWVAEILKANHKPVASDEHHRAVARAAIAAMGGDVLRAENQKLLGYIATAVSVMDDGLNIQPQSAIHNVFKQALAQKEAE